MKIALLTDGIYPFILGGMQKHSFYLAKYLAGNGIKVDLYHCVPNEDKLPDKLPGFSDEELENITSICIKFPKCLRFPGHYIFESYLYSSNLFNLFLKREPVDFIYSQGFSGWKFIKEKRGGRQLPSIGVNFHGLEMYQIAPNVKAELQHFILRLPVKYMLENTNLIFSLGGKLTLIQNEVTNGKKKIIEVPNGIEESWIVSLDNRVSTDSPKKFVFIGRYERRKGIEELSEVIQELYEYEFEFHFIGPISEEKKIKKKSKVFYHGKVSDMAFIKEILGKSDFLVCPSYSEGMPTVILEAMASGCGVIASDVGAVRSLVSESNGRLVEPGNKVQLKETILECLFLSDDEVIKIKKTSVEKVKKEFIWNKVVNQTIRSIQEEIDSSN